MLTGGSGSDSDVNSESSDATSVTATVQTDLTVASTTEVEPDVEDSAVGVETTESPATTESGATPEPPASGDLVGGAPDGIVGDRASPVPPGQFADLGAGWRLQVVDVIDDATERVLEESSLEPPPPGSRFTVVSVRLGYYGIDDPTSAFEVLLSGVGADDVELDDSCSFGPRSIQSFVEIFAGGVTTGELCFTTTPEDATVLQVAASTFGGNDDVFLDASSGDPQADPLPTLRGPQPGAAATTARLAPVPVGVSADVGDDWTLTVRSAATDITDAITSENSFDEPAPGDRYVGFPVELGYDGPGTASVFDVIISAVPDSNVAGSPFCGFFDDELDQSAEISTGGRLTGTVCVVVAEQEVPSLVAYAIAGLDNDPVFFSVGGTTGASAPTP